MQVAHASAPLFSFDSTNFDETALDTTFDLTLFGSGGAITSVSGMYDGHLLNSPSFEFVSGVYTGSGTGSQLDTLTIVFDGSGLPAFSFVAQVPDGSLHYGGSPVVTTGDFTSTVDGSTVGGGDGSGVQFVATAGAPEINGAVLPRAAAVMAGLLLAMLRLRRSGQTRELSI
jgi:hypothetical protein